MKLFNFKFNNNIIKNIKLTLKFIIIAFLIFYCLYILYFSSLKTIEGFSETYDCSNCHMKPYSGDCVPIYDLSYNSNLVNGNNAYSDFSMVQTEYIFCPWEPNCIGEDDYLANMLEEDERIGLSNEDFRSNLGLNNIRCCSGEDWYQTYTTSYFDVCYNYNIKEQCQNIQDYIQSLILDEDPNATADISFLTSDYLQLRNVCNTTDFSGMLFKKHSVKTNILLDPNLTIQEIFDYQNILELSYNTNLDGDRERIQSVEYEGQPFTIDYINTELTELLTTGEDVTTNGYTKTSLQKILKDFFISTISYEDISYQALYFDPIDSIDSANLQTFKPVEDSAGNTDYLLNSSEFFNCTGVISNTQDLSFSEEDIQRFEDEDFFGVSDETIKTASELTQDVYGPSMDLAMELKYLDTIQEGGTAPVSVINQYLTAINGFYENQIQNLLGPRTHSVNDQLVFDNETLESKESTFLVYENEPNNSYECQESVTGTDIFEYCGPVASSYYTTFDPT